MQLRRRSDQVDRGRLVETFVDVGPLLTLLSSEDHQIVFGRRGTGKTHALNYLSDVRSQEGDLVIYVDLSNLGSSGGIYSAQNVPITQRATRLLVDTLLTVYEDLYTFFVDHAEELNLSQTGPLLDEFGEATTGVEVVGETQVEESSGEVADRQSQSNVSASITQSNVQLGYGNLTGSHHQSNAARSVRTSGVAQNHVHFGSVSRVLGRITDVISPRKVWLLLDEWSSVPIDLQPYLADLLRRCVYPVRNIVTKIAAIEQRSQFSLPAPQGTYLGIEVGADAAADINLDDFMVFDNDSMRARNFYRSLLHKHVTSTEIMNEATFSLDSDVAFTQTAFTQINTFDELVRASEGVPRDSINIVIQAAQYADSEAISVQHIRRAAHAWYQRDKENAVRANDRAADLLHWIRQEVIGERRARAFLIRSDSTDHLFESLFDARVLHILKRNISTPEEPGTRHNVYKLDYGCYVDLMQTQNAPQGLFQLDELGDNEESQYIDVPPDDYRAIRRAILNLDDFYESVRHQ